MRRENAALAAGKSSGKPPDDEKDRLTNGSGCLCCGAEWWCVGSNGLMLLTGSYERSLDEKLRLALPKPLREALRAVKQLVITPGTDGSLSLFPGHAFADLAARLAARSPAGREVRAYSR